MHRYYPAILERGDASYGVSFPDFPGCIGVDGTPDGALRTAAEALSFHISGMAEDGEAIPDPTPIEAVVPDPEVDTVCVTLVPAALPGRARRINITLDEALIDQIDAVAGNRSGFLTEAARAELARRRPGR